MNCEKVLLHICESLDEDLHSARCREIRRHLEGCPNCRAYLDSTKKTVTLYRTEQAPRVPARVHSKLIKTINMAWEKESPRKQKHPPRGR